MKVFNIGEYISNNMSWPSLGQSNTSQQNGFISIFFQKIEEIFNFILFF